MDFINIIFELYSYIFNPELIRTLQRDKNSLPVDLDVYRLIYFYGFEQKANALFFAPNEYVYSIWSHLHIPVFFIYLMLFLIWSPLVFSMLILWMYLRNLYKNLNFAHIFTIEQNDIFFPVRDLKPWFAFYRTNFIFFLKGIYTNGYTLPNPLHLHKKLTMFLYFIWRPKPLVFRFFLFFLFFLLLILLDELTSSFFIILSLFFTNFICYKFYWISEPYGLKLKHFLVHFHKRYKGYRDDFSEWYFRRISLTQYPIFLSFSHFIITTSFIIILYFNFFFKPVLTWNGYFLKTIISFFFTGWETYSFKYFYNLDFFLGLDGLNIWLIWLTSLLVFLCSLFLWESYKNDTFYFQMGWIFFLQFASLQFFCVSSYFWMYVFFELSLLPIFVLIVYWGSNRWKIHAAYQMVLFTFLGSLFLLTGIILLFSKLKTFNTFDIFLTTRNDFDNELFSIFEKKIIWFLMFLGFAVKTPLYPFHIWLPEAHSEAPTTGSVLLAGVLLKMGTYGFLWFVIPLFPEILEFFKTCVFAMCICGIIFSSLAALSQVDIKKIIAYSSIGHMGLVILGIYSSNLFGLLGASFMMISHGLVSAALFFCVGLLYKIYGTWSLVYYSSLAHFMPKFSLCFFVFILANMGFPGTVGFPPEVLIFAALVGNNFFLTLLVGIGSIIGGTYSIWLLTWLLYGQISSKISFYRDINALEWKVLGYLTSLVIFFGIFPFLMLDFFKPFCIYFVF